ncbi:hypothetical protein BT69DRAFT_1284555 [Atractiella rhizophila]|nr:hypothetical protein BT69DRAFT_1284555 [Atractiella rhizophila]
MTVVEVEDDCEIEEAARPSVSFFYPAATGKLALSRWIRSALNNVHTRDERHRISLFVLCMLSMLYSEAMVLE